MPRGHDLQVSLESIPKCHLHGPCWLGSATRTALHSYRSVISVKRSTDIIEFSCKTSMVFLLQWNHSHWVRTLLLNLERQCILTFVFQTTSHRIWRMLRPPTMLLWAVTSKDGLVLLRFLTKTHWKSCQSFSGHNQASCGGLAHQERKNCS
jgi:hypothetical protein